MMSIEDYDDAIRSSLPAHLPQGSLEIAQLISHCFMKGISPDKAAKAIAKRLEDDAYERAAEDAQRKRDAAEGFDDE